MGNLQKSVDSLIDKICVGAWVINIGLLVFASIEGNIELQLLSLVNAFLLSFRLLRFTDKN